MFQHTATRRWLHLPYNQQKDLIMVSTHSHPKVAAYLVGHFAHNKTVSTHSHPKVAAPYIKKQEKSAN